MVKSPLNNRLISRDEINQPPSPQSLLVIRQYQIFFVFLRLGCISFGGPAAHLVFFHHTFVQQLKWLTGEEYNQVVALSQIIPGPSSSQVGMAIGYLKRGYLGAVSAWLGFTLPSFILMTTLAYTGQYFFKFLTADVFHILKLIVLSVVLYAFWQMLKSFCNAVWQYLLMLGAAFFIYIVDFDLNQILLIILAACCGLLFSTTPLKKNKNKAIPNLPTSYRVHSQKPAYLWLILFITPFLIFNLLKLITQHPALQSVESFYTAASMVFGGGHVVLPFLHQDFVSSGLISSEKFDFGYAIVQLMPGPLFSFASYLGALIPMTPYLWLNATIATCAIFLPSFFLIFGTLPYWSWLMKQEKIYRAVEGINAAVIGLLLYLIMQMTESTIHSWLDMGFVVMVLLLLRSKLPVILTLISSFSAYYAVLLYV